MEKASATPSKSNEAEGEIAKATWRLGCFAVGNYAAGMKVSPVSD